MTIRRTYELDPKNFFSENCYSDIILAIIGEKSYNRPGIYKINAFEAAMFKWKWFTWMPMHPPLVEKYIKLVQEGMT